MALRSTQSLTEMRYPLGGKGGRYVELTSLPPSRASAAWRPTSLSRPEWGQKTKTYTMHNQTTPYNQLTNKEINSLIIELLENVKLLKILKIF
jgi:hypothetical protein